LRGQHIFIVRGVERHIVYPLAAGRIIEICCDERDVTKMLRNPSYQAVESNKDGRRSRATKNYAPINMHIVANLNALFYLPKRVKGTNSISFRDV